jgi:Flp pilus assembly protein TadG
MIVCWGYVFMSERQGFIMFQKNIKSWRTQNKGVVVIEFALVGLPFIIMLIGFIEVCLFFSSAVSLEGATNDAARMIRTGQVQAAGDPVQVFQNELCSQVNGLINCSSLQYQVIPIAGNSFANAALLAPQFDASGNLMNQSFNPGASSGDILVRVVYPYVFLTPFLGKIIMGGAATQATLMSTIVIQNEPYKFGN